MAGAIVVSQFGGPEVLEWKDVDPGQAGAGEVLIRYIAVGLNFIDVYHRTGLYPIDPPITPGVEGAGVIEALGEGVDDLAVGDRVAHTGNAGPGSYCELRVLPRSKVYKLPDSISNETAAAIMLKGATVEYLVRRTYPVKEGTWALLHAAAGGVGLIASQWLKALGAHVIGTVGTEEKAELARANGCEHTILYRDEDVPTRVKEITDGRGVDVAYDSVGASTFFGSMDSLKPRGLMVTFGNASGPVEAIMPLELAKRGSLYLTRPRVMDYYATQEDADEGVAALFDVVGSGKVKPHVGAHYPLREVGRAHEDLEARKTVGSTVLDV